MATAKAEQMPIITEEVEEGESVAGAAAAAQPLLEEGHGRSRRGTPHCDRTTVLAVGGGFILCIGVLALVLYILWSGINHKKVL